MANNDPCLAGLMALIGLAALYRAHFRPWRHSGGEDEITDSLPGDELVTAHTPVRHEGDRRRADRRCVAVAGTDLRGPMPNLEPSASVGMTTDWSNSSTGGRTRGS